MKEGKGRIMIDGQIGDGNVLRKLMDEENNGSQSRTRR